MARAFGATPGAAGIIALALTVAVVALVLAQCAFGGYAPNDRLALACAALPLTLGFAHEHDFAIAFFPALVTVRRARGATWVVAAVALLGAGVDWLGLAQRPTGVAETTALTLAAALGLAALVRDRLRPYHFVPLAMAAAVALTGAAVAGHPLPTWPDGLGANFHVPFSVPAPAVWHAEQIRSGIGALDPVWAALRLASLASCALVWIVASRVLRAGAPVRVPGTPPRSAVFATRPQRPGAAYPSD